MSKSDPVEFIVRNALVARGVDFSEEPARQNHGLDFYLPEYETFIECKQFASNRTEGQLLRQSNIILIQGMKAAHSFAELLNGERPED